MADEIKVSISGDSAGLQAATKQATDALGALNKVVEKTGEGLEASAAPAKQEAEALSQVTAAAARLTEALGRATAAVDQAAVSLASIDKAAAAAQASARAAATGLAETATAAHGAAAAHEQFSLATAGARRELIVLAHEATMGNWTRFGPSLMVLGERAGGVTLGMMGIAGAVAVAALVIGEMAVHSEELDRSLGAMQAGLMGVGRGSDYTREGIFQIIEQLRALPGVSTKAAEAMVTAFSRQREIGVGSYAALGTAAAGFARVSGEDVPKAAERLAAALEEGYGAILKLDNAYNFLSPSQRAQIQAFGEMGDKAAVLNIAIPAVEQHFGALTTAGLTPMQAASNSFGVAWANMLDALHDTGPIVAARDAITGLLNATARGMKQAYDTGSIEHLKSDLAALQSQRDRLQGENDKGWLGLAPQSEIDALDAEIDKTRALIVMKVQAAATGVRGTSANGENDPDVQIKTALGLEERLGLAAAKREQIEGRIAEIKRGAAAASAQADKASTGGDTAGAAAYQAEAARLTADAAELQTQLDQLHAKGGEKRVQAWQDQLDQQLLAQNAFGAEATAIEVKFWSERLKETTAGTNEQLQVEKRLYAARKAAQSEQASLDKQAAAEADKAAKDRFDADVSKLRDQQAAHQEDFTVRIALEQQILDLYRQFYGDDTKAYGDELKRKEDLLRQSADQQRRIREVELKGAEDRAKIQEGQDLKRQPSDGYGLSALLSDKPNQDLAGQQAKLTTDNLASQGAMMGQLAGATNPVEIASIYQQLETAQAQYNAKSAALNQEAAANVQKSWSTVLAPIDRAFTQTINGMLQGTETLRQGVARAGQSIALSFIDAAEKGLMKWVAAELTKLTTHETTEAGMTAATAANQTAQTAIKDQGKAAEAAGDSASILNHAYTAASGAYAWAVPDVGPVLAAAAAAAAFAGVMSFDVISAAGGMADVPFDGMAAVLHKQEMVLPASIATPLRSAIGSWGVPPLAASNVNLPMAAPAGGSGGAAFHWSGDVNVARGNPTDIRTAMLGMLNDLVRNGAPAQYPHLARAFGAR